MSALHLPGSPSRSPELTAADNREHTGVAMVSERFARRFWNTTDVVGRHVVARHGGRCRPREVTVQHASERFVRGKAGVENPVERQNDVSDLYSCFCPRTVGVYAGDHRDITAVLSMDTYPANRLLW